MVPPSTPCCGNDHLNDIESVLSIGFFKRLARLIDIPGGLSLSEKRIDRLFDGGSREHRVSVDDIFEYVEMRRLFVRSSIRLGNRRGRIHGIRIGRLGKGAERPQAESRDQPNYRARRRCPRVPQIPSDACNRLRCSDNQRQGFARCRAANTRPFLPVPCFSFVSDV